MENLDLSKVLTTAQELNQEKVDLDKSNPIVKVSTRDIEIFPLQFGEEVISIHQMKKGQTIRIDYNDNTGYHHKNEVVLEDKIFAVIAERHNSVLKTLSSENQDLRVQLSSLKKELKEKDDQVLKAQQHRDRADADYHSLHHKIEKNYKPLESKVQQYENDFAKLRKELGERTINDILTSESK